MIRKKLNTSLLAIAALLSFVSASHAQPQSLMTRHVREVTITGEAKPAGRLPASQSMRLEIVLPLRHRPELENFVHDLYDRTSPNFRHYVTVEQFADRFGPNQEDYDAVVNFAKANGFTVESTSRNRLNVGVRATVATIENCAACEHGRLSAPD